MDESADVAPPEPLEGIPRGTALREVGFLPEGLIGFRCNGNNAQWLIVNNGVVYRLRGIVKLNEGNIEVVKFSPEIEILNNGHRWYMAFFERRHWEKNVDEETLPVEELQLTARRFDIDGFASLLAQNTSARKVGAKVQRCRRPRDFNAYSLDFRGPFVERRQDGRERSRMRDRSPGSVVSDRGCDRTIDIFEANVDYRPDGADERPLVISLGPEPYFSDLGEEHKAGGPGTVGYHLLRMFDHLLLKKT